MVAAAPEKGSCCAYTAQSGLFSEGVSSHLNVRNKMRFALATEEFVTLFLRANWTSCQSKRPEAAICHRMMVAMGHGLCVIFWLSEEMTNKEENKFVNVSYLSYGSRG